MFRVHQAAADSLQQKREANYELVQQEREERKRKRAEWKLQNPELVAYSRLNPATPLNQIRKLVEKGARPKYMANPPHGRKP